MRPLPEVQARAGSTGWLDGVGHCRTTLDSGSDRRDEPFSLGQNGYQYVLVFQDLSTKWVEVAPISTAVEPTIKQQFEELVVSRWGAPEVVHADNGTEFSNRLIEHMCKSMDIIHTTNPVYDAQENPTERVNRVSKTMSANHRSLKVTLAFWISAANLCPIFHCETRSALKKSGVTRNLPEGKERMRRLSHLRVLNYELWIKMNFQILKIL